MAQARGTHKARAGSRKAPAPPGDAVGLARHNVLRLKNTMTIHGIAEATILKNEDVFFLANADGDVPMTSGHGFGLYYHDTRYLNGYALRLDGLKPTLLAANGEKNYKATFALSNPHLPAAKGAGVPMQTLGLMWSRRLDAGRVALVDELVVRNHGLEAIACDLSLSFRSAFEDMLYVRGLVEQDPEKLFDPIWQAGALRLASKGADGLYRTLTIHLDPAPDAHEDELATFRLALASGAETRLLVMLVITEGSEMPAFTPERFYPPDLATVDALLERGATHWLQDNTRPASDNQVVNHVLDRSLRDLHALRTDVDGDPFFCAGVPWYATLFGRDSLIAAMQVLAYHPRVAASTLRLLAKLQGVHENPWKDEEPGKIAHELRVGELTRMGELPFSPYYGSVDATLWFLIVLGRYVAWTGDVGLFQALRGHVEAALGWIAHFGQVGASPYVVYQSKSADGLVNQGWKDSGDAIMNLDGSLATGPIALVEVQGYVYLAKHLVADLCEHAGEGENAKRLRAEAVALKLAFNRDFWVDDLQFYALALQGDGEPAAVVSSNPGQALWTGIIDDSRVPKVVEQLMAPDMFSGWGIRTLSTRAKRFNPTGYHLGTVWPHDNALIVAGMRRYGFDAEAFQVFDGLLEASTHFDLMRLPELFAGFSREALGQPVRYPVACHPQAWAAGAMPFLFETMLGLRPDAPNQRLRIVRPMLPSFTRDFQLTGLGVGQATVDLRFTRTGDDGAVAVEVVRCQGQLEVKIDG